MTIYPSEFGKERMEQERRQGPGAFLGLDNDVDGGVRGEGEEEEEGGVQTADAVDMAKLRKYEADKMKYYYAVAVFDSVTPQPQTPNSKL